MAFCSKSPDCQAPDYFRIMREIALHLLDIAENSVAAQARNITISVVEDLYNDKLTASVEDDGCGMEAEMVARVVDPFVTSRTTRKVGLGIPLLKAAAEACNGSLAIQSAPGKGTLLRVEFQRSHIDRMPLGDLAGTFLTLVIAFPGIHWKFEYRVKLPETGEEQVFLFDDQPVKNELQGVSLCQPEVLSYLRETLERGVAALHDLTRATEPDFPFTHHDH